MQLFDNYLVSRREDQSNNDQFTGANNQSPKARAVRAELLSLLPPAKDIFKIINESSKFWCTWEETLPELRVAFESMSNNCDSSVAPADIAKAIVCLSLSVMQAPPNFDFDALEKPFEPEEFTTRCTAAADRLVARDDDFAATLPGIETQMLLSKFHTHEGRLRKAWLVNRRAIEFAHLAGMHLSTRSPRASDVLFERRLKIWCSLAISDRSLSLMLGLPYEISDAFVLPQIQSRLKSSDSGSEQYMLRIGVITGHMIDRNQNPAEMCLESTLRLDQELMDVWDTLPKGLVGVELDPAERFEHYYERVALQFMPQVLRTIIHMPVMLKYPHDPRFIYCHQMAIQSARKGLALYKVLRSITRSYLCKVIDFLSFTMAMLLIVHLMGHSQESPEHSKTQDQDDWQLVGEIVGILRQAAAESRSSVAAESAHILGEIFDSRDQERNWSPAMTCRVTVPYFGTITVGAGSKLSRCKSRGQETHVPGSDPLMPAVSPSKQTPTQTFTPPISDPGVTSNSSADNLSTSLSGTSFAIPQDDPAIGNLTGLESNLFTGLFDDFGQYMWPSANVDLGLDQGWNLNWSA